MKDNLLYIIHIKESIETIQKYAQGMDAKSFFKAVMEKELNGVAKK